MKQYEVEMQSQNVYAGTGGASMEEKYNEEDDQQQEGEELKIAKNGNRDAEKKGRKGIIAFVTKLLEGATAPIERSSKPPEGKGQKAGAPASKESKPKEPKKPPLPKATYFSKLPKNPVLAHEVEKFVVAANGKPLSGVGTEFLVEEVLYMGRVAARLGNADTGFLKELREELQRRDIDPIRLERESYKAVDEEVEKINVRWKEATGRELTDEEKLNMSLGQNIPIPKMAGGAPDLTLTEIHDPTLRRLGEAINFQMGHVGEKEDTLNARYGEVVGLTGVNEDEKQILLNEISQAMGRAYHGEVERRQQREAEMEEERRESMTRGWYGERRMTPQMRREIGELIDNNNIDELDKRFNQIFEYAEANPHEDFHSAMGQAGVQEYSYWISTLNELRDNAMKLNPPDVRKGDQIRILIEKYSAEHKLRNVLHDAFYIAETGGPAEQFAKYTQQFASEFTDLAFFERPEVEIALRMREQVLYQIKRENGGRIPYEKVAFIVEKGGSQWEERTQELLREANRAGLISSRGPIEEWKLDRALSISRGLGMVMLRFPEIIAECPLQHPESTPQSNPSLPWETISWELNPLDHKLKRYKIGRAMGAILYAKMKRTKKGLWSQKELEHAMSFQMVDSLADMDNDEHRIADLRTIFKIGGPFTHSSWRSYASALNEDDLTSIRKLLDSNPGLAMRTMWNSYEIEGMGKPREEFLKRYRQENPDVSGEQILKAWEEEAARLKTQNPEKQWTEADLKAFENAAKRIPHSVLRIITDDANKLLSKGARRALRESVYGGLSTKDAEHLENDLTLAKEHLMKRRRENRELFEQHPELDQLMDEDFAIITDEHGRRERARNLYRIVNREITQNEGLRNNILARLKDKQFPFAVTLEDVAWGEFRFAQTGGRGLITRRNNDWYEDVQANDIMLKMLQQIPEYQGPDQIVAELGKIFNHARIHDEDRAYEAIQTIAKGIIQVYRKDGITKIPIFGEIMGVVNAIRRRGNSFAQTAYGARAPEWDSDDIYNFTEMLRQFLPLHMVEELRKETGGTVWKAFGKKTKLALYFLLIFGFYDVAESIVKE